MSAHVETLTVPYRPDDMFSLVSDIEAYPRFIKWIKALRVSQPRDDGQVRHCIGEAVVGFKGFTERFATSVAADAAARTVTVRLVRGPFRRLENDWRFEPEGESGTRIHFRIDYEFSNFMLQALAMSNRENAVRRIMESFLDEAERRFGGTEVPPSNPPSA